MLHVPSGLFVETASCRGHGACIFVLANRDDAPVGLVADGVEQILFEEPLTASFPKALPADVLEHLVGEYVDEKGNRLQITKSGTTLRAVLLWAAGMVSRMTVTQQEGGKLVMIQGTYVYDLELGSIEDGKCTALMLLESRYVRAGDE